MRRVTGGAATTSTTTNEEKKPVGNDRDAAVAACAYAVAARTAAHVAAAVNFARLNNLRLVVKGGGHSYQRRATTD